MIRTALFALFVLLPYNDALVAEPASLKTVEHVDLARYVGRWYEIARTPNPFEKKCVRDVVAEYTLEGSNIRVRNSCIKTDGKPTASTGKAKVVDSATNAKLKVTFFWPFYGDYWIIGLDREYRWAVVGEPDRKYLWVLSRMQTLSREDRQVIERIIAEHGYQPSAVLWQQETSIRLQ